MQRHRFAAGLALALLAILGLIGPVAAGEQVPFKGVLEGGVTVTPVNPPFIVDVLVEATGTATQLGLFTVDIPHRVDRSTAPPSAVGTCEFVAANGATVRAVLTGQSLLIAPGLLYIVETATITGGTGRFKGATGSFAAERWFDTISGTTIGYFEGTISSPGK